MAARNFRKAKAKRLIAPGNSAVSAPVAGSVLTVLTVVEQAPALAAAAAAAALELDEAAEDAAAALEAEALVQVAGVVAVLITTFVP